MLEHPYQQEGKTALMFALDGGVSKSAVKMLLKPKHGADVNLQNKVRDTVQGSEKSRSRLSWLNAHTCQQEGWTALMLVASKKHLDAISAAWVVKLLLQSGAHVHLKNKVSVGAMCEALQCYEGV